MLSGSQLPTSRPKIADLGVIRDLIASLYFAYKSFSACLFLYIWVVLPRLSRATPPIYEYMSISTPIASILNEFLIKIKIKKVFNLSQCVARLLKCLEEIKNCRENIIDSNFA